MKRKFWTDAEDQLIRQYAGIKTAAELAIMTGRPKNGVHHRMKKLALDGRMTGEKHWNAKIKNIQAAMIGALYDAGFTVNEIHRLATAGMQITLGQINNIAACRSRRGQLSGRA